MFLAKKPKVHHKQLRSSVFGASYNEVNPDRLMCLSENLMIIEQN